MQKVFRYLIEKPQAKPVLEKPKPEPKRENVESRPTIQQNNTGERFLIYGEISLDMQTRRLKMRGQIINIPPTTFDYLVVLVRHAPNVVGYQALIAEAKGNQADFREAQQQVKWHMHHIRQALKAIEANPSKPIYLINQRGVGYRLVTD
jgi:DNA-binding response OmpR family regulator